MKLLELATIIKRPFAFLWEKAPLLFLLTLYLSIALFQKIISDKYPIAPERYFRDNYVQVTKGSICVPSGQNMNQYRMH